VAEMNNRECYRTKIRFTLNSVPFAT
jgi:hypothetical protein